MIPINEQPYPLPDGWQWGYADKIFDIKYGNGLLTKDLISVGYPVFGANGQIGFYNHYMYEEPKALMSCRGAYSGTMNKSLPFSYVTNNSLIITDAAKKMSADFIFYLFSAINKEALISGTAQPQVTIRAFKNFPIPLPPRDEQKRIVFLLDELFSKLDEAKALAQAVVDGSKLRRAAILHKAFSGELSQLWRDEHGSTLDGWQKKFLSDALISSKQKTTDFSSSDLKYVGLENMEKDGGQISFQTADDVRSTKNIFRAGDLLYGKLRPYLNKHGVAKFDGVCSTDILVFKASEQAEIEFINYFLNLPRFIEYAVANSKGINLPRVSEKFILRAEIFLPTLEEQKEIVRLLDDLLGREQQTKDHALKTMERVELMKKSILARAFRGELGTKKF